MKIYIGKGTLTDYSECYSRTYGALSINDNFDKNARSATATFSLIDPPSIPEIYEMVEIYHPDDSILFSGIVKAVEKIILGYDEKDDARVYNAAVYRITADSWEVKGSDMELISYESYFSQTAGYIIKDIVTKYLPHIGTTYLDEGFGPTFSRVVFVNRRPNEAITAICEKVGYYWYVTPDREAHINFIGGTNISPVEISDITDYTRKIDLNIAESIEERINDLFIRAKSVKGSVVQEYINADGFTGNYPLKKQPWGLNTVIPIIDEFAGGDSPGEPDSGKWTLIDPGEEDLLYTQDGRLQIIKGINPNLLISKQLVGSGQPLRARDLEVEFTSIDSGHYFAFGLHNGTETTSLDNILLGIRINDDLTVDVIESGVATATDFSVTLNTGDPQAYSFKILVSSGIYYVYAQTPDQLASGTPASTLVASGSITLPAYVAFCPAFTSGGVGGTVIQGSLALTPEFWVFLEEIQWISSVGEKTDTWINCEHANWTKFQLKGLTLVFYDTDGTEYDTNPMDGKPFTISMNNAQQISLISSPLTQWFIDNNIVKFKMQGRMLLVSNSQANDYETHCFIEVVNGIPTLRFYQGEIPCGHLRVEYFADMSKVFEVYDAEDIAFVYGVSGVPEDTGKRKEFQETESDIQTIDELLQYAKAYLESQGHGFAQGTIETNSDLISDARVYSGMDQAISGLMLGVEMLGSGTPITTYISGLSITDAGGGILTYSINLGNIKDFVHDLFVAKLNVLHKTGMVIDDLGDEERLTYRDRIELGDIDNHIDPPVVSLYWFDDQGIHLEWTKSAGSTNTEIRTDENYGTAGTGRIYFDTGTSLDIAFEDIKRRKYVFHLYAVTAAGVYSTHANIVTVENKQPITAPLNDIDVMADGVVRVVFAKPFEADVYRRLVYVNNAYTEDDNLVDSDIILEADPWDASVEFMAYAATLYITIVDQDIYYELDDKPIRFDRTLQTGIICRPPKEPWGFYVTTRATDEELQNNQIKVHIPYTEDPDFGKVETFHIQFSPDGTYPEPNTDLPSGEGTAELLTANSTLVRLPLGALDTVPDPTNCLFVLKEAFAVVGSDSSGSYTSKMWYQGRYILNAWDDGVNDWVEVNGNFLKDQGDYDWEVWSKWYEDPSLAAPSLNIPVAQDQYVFTENEYEYILTLPVSSAIYARCYAVNRFGLIGPVEDLTPFTVTDVSPSDTDVPSLPQNVTATHIGKTIYVRWEDPAENINTLRRFLIRIGKCDYTDDGDGTYSIATYVEWTVAAGQNQFETDVTEVGQYAIAVLAQNDVGTSDWSIYWWY